MNSVKLPTIVEKTAADDLKIRQGIEADPDTWEISAQATPLKRGRPVGSNKSQVTIKLDNDVLTALKSPEGKGWQTRLNATLREALGL